MKSYCAVIRRSASSDQMTHWKYIKREKKDGKWVYYYDDTELNKYRKNVREETVDEDGNKVFRTTTDYKQTDDLFDNVSTSKNRWGMDDKEFMDTNIVKAQGSISRLIADGEKWVYDNLLRSKK